MLLYMDIFEDLKELMGFEDKIMPVEECCARRGDRISILGGVDMDVLGRGSEEEVRARTRQILEACAPGGGCTARLGTSSLA
jgi:uroporphyrinogen decarboxylase